MKQGQIKDVAFEQSSVNKYFYDVYTEPDMQNVIMSVAGVLRCDRAYTVAGEYQVRFDPRYDPEVVKAGIEKAIADVLAGDEDYA